MNDYAEIVQIVCKWVMDNWEPLATVITLIVVVRTYRKSRKVWARKNFINRINFSLNYLEDNVLKIRTLSECDIDEVILNNPHGKQLVLQYAKHKTSLHKPFLEFPEHDRWLILNSILNHLSEQFATGFLAHSLGLPVKTATYVFGMTCERDPRVSLNKIRVMLVEKSFLGQVDALDETIQFERESHKVRLETLKRMLEIHRDEKRRPNLLEVELGILGT